MLKRKLLSLICLTSLLPLSAQAIQLCGEKVQGDVMRGKAPDAEAVYFNDQKLTLSKDGDFLIAFDRDEKISKPQIIKVVQNGEETQYTFKVSAQKWDVQKVNGLPQKTVTPSEKDQKDIEKERSDIRGAQSWSSPLKLWKKGFVKPTQGRTSGNFGGQRIMNGEPRNPHLGMDIAAQEGTIIESSTDGIVTLAGGPYFYSGNVVVINHGFGLFTIYAHMKDIKVKKNDRVIQGQVIGTVGKTGRANGPHLHWGASLNGIRFDANSLLKLNNDNLCFNL